MPSLPIVLVHGIARFDILTKALEQELNLPENHLTDQLEYFKGIKGTLEAHGFTVSHPNQSFAGSLDLRAEQLRDRVSTKLLQHPVVRRCTSLLTAWAASMPVT